MDSPAKQLKSLVLPFSAAVIIPSIVLFAFRQTVWGINIYAPCIQFSLGPVLILSGLCLMFITIRLFIQIGKGTLAPWEPTKKLVAAGIYRHTRNPMITGVTAILLGETVATGSAGLLVWAVLFFILNTVYFKLSEEPGLEARFGDDYVEYRKNVPMWLPRIKPWDHE